MHIIECKNHEKRFSIPSEKSEYLSGRFHEEIQRLNFHHQENPNCKFVEVREET